MKWIPFSGSPIAPALPKWVARWFEAVRIARMGFQTGGEGDRPKIQHWDQFDELLFTQFRLCGAQRGLSMQQMGKWSEECTTEVVKRKLEKQRKQLMTICNHGNVRLVISFQQTYLFCTVPQMWTVISCDTVNFPFLWFPLDEVILSVLFNFFHIFSGTSFTSASGLTPTGITVSVTFCFPALLIFSPFTRGVLRACRVWL